jgi:hypothetical protein
MSGADRKKALLQRVRAKEAAQKATALPIAATKVERTIDVAIVHCRIAAKRPLVLQPEAEASWLGPVSKRHKPACL